MLASVETTGGATTLLKDQTGRTRPDSSNREFSLGTQLKGLFLRFDEETERGRHEHR